jgi:hypothetical protein
MNKKLKKMITEALKVRSHVSMVPASKGALQDIRLPQEDPHQGPFIGKREYTP